jgi:DTW domain-containing protein YfiP
MSRRDNVARRCAGCHLLDDGCVCALIPSPPLAISTRVVLVIHREEERKPTNTGRLATRCLAGSEVIVRGHAGAPTPPIAIAPGTRPLLLFPHPDATPLVAPRTGEPPVTLIVPDGTWRQAGKVRRRVPGLDAVPCVTLPPGPPTRYRLRHEPVAGGLATLEAIARALDVLDGPHVRAALERVFDAMVAATLRARGQA